MINLRISTKTNYDRMLDGELFTGMDEDLFHMVSQTQARVSEYHAMANSPFADLHAKLKEIVGEIGEFSIIVPPVTMEYGRHVRLGRRVFVNLGTTFMDSALVTIGDNTMVGPYVRFITSGHPMSPKKRYIETPGAPHFPYRTVSIAHPITIGADCWIGTGSTILAGVTIGEGTTIGAGSVVTRDIPANVFAAGNPARVIREIK